MTPSRPFGGTPRFELLRTLGEGGMGVVYEALDKESDTRVALKTIRLPSADGLARFKKEFRTLQDLQHRNLVRLDELFEADGTWFFTMELVDGIDFLRHVRPEGAHAELAVGSQQTRDTATGKRVAGSIDEALSAAVEAESESDASADVDVPTQTVQVTVASRASAPSLAAIPDPAARARRSFDERRLRDALRQLVLALCAVHDAHKIHRDVKPGNILVAPDGRVVLLDFGLISDAFVADGVTRPTGTVAFMAPEQLSNAAVGPAADWYAVGVTLYQALTGRRPFAGTVHEIIELKQYVEPLAPSRFVEDLPADLEALCVELLARDPARRPDGPEILRRLGAARPVDRARRRGPLVGRDRERAALRGAYADVERHRGVAVLVSGESGVGKSVLVQAFLSEVRAGASLVLAGRCYERESVPYKAFDEIMEGLGRALAAMPPAELAPLLPPRVALIAEMFPTLRQVDAIDDAVIAGAGQRAADALQGRNAVFAELRELWTRLARRGPVVVAIDDLQWADADSLSLLAAIMRAPAPAPFLLCATVRREAGGLGPEALRAHLGADVREVPVLRLGPEAAHELAATLLSWALGEVSEDAIRAVADEAQGHPMFIEALIRHRAAHPDAARPVRLDEALVARTEGLDPEAVRLLQLVCVAGVPLRQEIGARALGVAFGALAPHIASLRAASLVKTDGLRRAASIEAYHDRVRESVVATLPPEPRRETHQRLARAIEDSGDGDPEMLAFHFHESGDDRRASGHAESAAARARAALAFDHAARLYGMALELGAADGHPEGDGEGDRTQRLRLGLAEALGNAGRGAESAEVYVAATEHAPPEQQLELRRRAAEQLLLSGRIDEGTRQMRAVLATVGLSMPATKARALARLIVNRARVRLRGADLRIRLRDRASIDPAVLSRLEACWSMAVGMSIVDPIRGADFSTRHLLYALKAGDPFRIACGVAAEACFAAADGGRGETRSLHLAQKAAQLAASCGQPEALGQAAFAAGFVEYCMGRFSRGRAEIERAEAIFRGQCAGVTWWTDTTQYLSLECLYYTGEIAELCRRVPIALADAQARGDLYAATNFQLGLPHTTWLFNDDLDGARRHAVEGMASWPSTDFYIQHEAEQVAQVNTFLYAGDGAAAHRRMTEVWRAYSRSAIFTVQLARVAAFHERARAALGAAVECPAGSPERRALVAEARHAAKRLVREGIPWGKALAALARAGACAAEGDRDGARAELDGAMVTLDACEMKLYAALARLRWGELVGGGEGRAMVEVATAWMRDQAIRRPDRIAAMLAPGF